MDPQGQAEEILEIVLSALKTRLNQIEQHKRKVASIAKNIVLPPVEETVPLSGTASMSVETWIASAYCSRITFGCLRR